MTHFLNCIPQTLLKVWLYVAQVMGNTFMIYRMKIYQYCSNEKTVKHEVRLPQKDTLSNYNKLLTHAHINL